MDSLFLLLVALILLLPQGFALLGCLGLLPACCRLLLKSLGLRLLSLRFVNCLNQHTLVLVCVTLGFVVAEVVEVLVNLFAFTILAEQASEDSLAPHPKNL